MPPRASCAARWPTSVLRATLPWTTPAWPGAPSLPQPPPKRCTLNPKALFPFPLESKRYLRGFCALQKKRGVKEQAGAAVVVVGTGSGDIIAWNTALGELQWRASDCHAGYVMSSTLKSNHKFYECRIHICRLHSLCSYAFSSLKEGLFFTMEETIIL